MRKCTGGKECTSTHRSLRHLRPWSQQGNTRAKIVDGYCLTPLAHCSWGSVIDNWKPCVKTARMLQLHKEPMLVMKLLLLSHIQRSFLICKACKWQYDLHGQFQVCTLWLYSNTGWKALLTLRWAVVFSWATKTRCIFSPQTHGNFSVIFLAMTLFCGVAPAD